MAINNVELSTTFNEWRVITNEIITAVGDNDSLSTTEKSNLVGALNEVLTKLGTIASLNTTVKTSAVAAINELVASIGTLASLSTTEKGSLVGAVNELDGEVGDLSNLDTDVQTSIVNAINELQQEILDTIDGTDDLIGELASLNTTDQSDVVSAINEVNTKTGDTSTLTTTATDNAAAINELDDEVGDLSTLNTTEKGSLVGSINEVQANKVISANVPVENKEINHGRFSAETVRALTTFDDTTTGLVEYNSAAFAEGEKFIDDNADNGGAGGSLGSDALALVTALGNAGRVDLQNGYEFYILDVTAGGGTSDGQNVTAIDYYPIASGDDSFIGSIGSTISYQFWCRLETLATPANNGIILGDTSVTTYVNGVQDNQALLEVADGWVHVRQTAVLTNEFKKFFPAIFANVGDVINIALPCLYQANVNNGIHVGVM